MRVGLLPSHLEALDAAGERLPFALALRWDGDVRVVPGSPPTRWPGRGTIAVIAPERCLRRRLRVRPHNRAELRALAADLFPFDITEAPLALYQRSDGLDVCVLAEADRTAVAGATAALVAAPNAPAILAALHRRLAHGEVFDFAPAPPRLVGPAPVLAALHVVLLAATLGGALGLSMMGQSAQQRALRADALRLQEEAQPLSQRRQVTAAMVRGVEELAQFSRRPAAALVPQVAALLKDMPSGTLVDKIGFKGGQLTISGLGNEAADWLERNGVGDTELQVADLPKTDRFTVTKTLPLNP